MDTFTCIQTRRSTRTFAEKALEPEKLAAVIEAGRLAPSGGNSRSLHLIVVTNREVLRRLADVAREEFAAMEVREGMYRSIANSIGASKRGNYVFHYDPPAFIVVANKKGYPNAMADSACALENMMLAANALDLGSCWINQLHWLDENPRVNAYLRELGLKEDETVCGALSLGYAESLNRTPRQSETGNAVTYVR